jgi:hypothetical protein
MQIRKGPQKALIALAHHMITIVFNVLKRGEEYVELGGDYFDRSNKPKVVSRLVARLAKLGFSVELRPIDPDAPEAHEPVLNEAVHLTVGEPREQPKSPAEDRSPETTKPKGRPCKCIERGILCKHGRGQSPNVNKAQGLTVAEFS